jgi:hypothetical protein
MAYLALIYHHPQHASPLGDLDVLDVNLASLAPAHSLVKAMI